MKTGERWSLGKASAVALVCAVALLHAPGCAKDRASVEKNLMAQQSELRREAAAEHYRAGCPDVIELMVPHRLELTGRFEIGPDGRIELGEYGNLRVEGKTAREIAKLVGEETGENPEKVQVKFTDFRSQHILLFGEVIGWQRSIPYHGQETVLDLLQRVGGITPGAEPNDVYVVRPHLGDNRRPEVFHVDLQAIVLKHDHKSNICLLPFDQVFVGETRRAQIQKALPPWMHPAYQALWNSKPRATE